MLQIAPQSQFCLLILQISIFPVVCSMTELSSAGRPVPGPGSEPGLILVLVPLLVLALVPVLVPAPGLVLVRILVPVLVLVLAPVLVVLLVPVPGKHVKHMSDMSTSM